MTPMIDFTKQRYLPQTPEVMRDTPMGILGVEALHEALAGGANAAARVGMARIIAAYGRRFTAEARHHAASICAGYAPLPPIPVYMVKP